MLSFSFSKLSSSLIISTARARTSYNSSLRMCVLTCDHANKHVRFFGNMCGSRLTFNSAIWISVCLLVLHYTHSARAYLLVLPVYIEKHRRMLHLISTSDHPLPHTYMYLCAQTCSNIYTNRSMHINMHIYASLFKLTFHIDNIVNVFPRDQHTINNKRIYILV